MTFCLNCGHKCHCGEYCYQKYDEGGETICCKYCRCEKKTKKKLINEDLFNGA